MDAQLARDKVLAMKAEAKRHGYACMDEREYFVHVRYRNGKFEWATAKSCSPRNSSEEGAARVLVECAWNSDFHRPT